ncbi:hypothetical protein CFC21_027618 [Triticum aestivum]|uniref:DUF7378 domain-containing protein n=2 Tax=Triticum aestivum TaxID=4565 RepID=A0A9R1JDI9_WHEAT|nr:hypothetical protein CFC21_027618 [Triticum aestivum]
MKMPDQIKSAKATDDESETGTTTPPALMTVGEANARAGDSRAVLWAAAVILPSVYVGGTSAWAYALYTHTSFGASHPWRLPAMVLWGAYMALVAAAAAHMSLCLPDAPVALQEALVDVGWVRVGMPVMVVNQALAYFGSAWMVVAIDCVLGVLIAGVLGFWVWLVRTYGRK